jgi:hypothetical protein
MKQNKRPKSKISNPKSQGLQTTSLNLDLITANLKFAIKNVTINETG